MRPILFHGSLLSFTVLGFAAAAQDSAAPDPAYVEMRPVSRSNPDYPSRALSSGKEGWVALSLVVSASGDVTEAMVEQSSGGEEFEVAALRAVAQWKYEPATQEGVPVEALWWAKYVYLSRTSPSDAAQMRRALERAVGADEEDMCLSMAQFVAAAERLVVLHAQASDIAAAIATFERLRDAVAKAAQDPATATLRTTQQYTQSVAGLQPGYDAMLELVASDRLMAMNGEVGEFDYWVHDLLRPSFSFANIQGRLEALDIRCERGRRRYDSIPVDTVWRVPEKWGACGVYLKGEPGSTFAFREYPASFAAPAAVDVGAR